MRGPSIQPLVHLGNRAAAATLRPLTRVASTAAATAAEVGVELERRTVGTVLDSAEFERMLGTVLQAPRLQSAIRAMLTSDGFKDVITDFVDGGAFDALADALLASDALWRLVDGVMLRLGESDALYRLIDQVIDHLDESEALWQLVDEVAGSPAVTAAITQQGLGFADQVGGVVRVRSRHADDVLDRLARRLTLRRIGEPSDGADAPAGGDAPS